MRTQPGSIENPNLFAPMDQYGNYYNQINSASQASVSNPGPYVPFVDAVHQSFRYTCTSIISERR
jgi:hypothetical protein